MKKIGLFTLAATIALTYSCQQLPFQAVSNQSLQSNPIFRNFSTYKSEPTTKWTIMVHMAAENNLSAFGIGDMDEMAMGLTQAQSKDVNVIVLYDGTGTGDSAIYKLKPEGRDKIDDKGAVIPVNTHEVDSGSAKVAQDFFQWAIKTYPAQHYMIDIWDHGYGIFKDKPDLNKSIWTGMFKKIQNPASSFSSDKKGTQMETSDLIPILGTAAQTAGKKIDIFGFDACLMSHLELAYQVKDYCDIFVASEEEEPGAGWDYKSWLPSIGVSTINPVDVASSLVTSYGKFYHGGQRATLSAIDTKAVTSNLIPALNNLSVNLLKEWPNNKNAIIEARNAAQGFLNKDCKDIGSFLTNLKNSNISPAITQSANNSLSIYKKSILNVVHADDQNATGMVIYFPNPIFGYNTEYDSAKDILFAQHPSWGNFLKTFVKN